MGNDCIQRFARVLGGLAAVVAVAACSLMPPILNPSRSIPFGTSSNPDVVHVLSTTPWWKSFRDPILNDLVSRGLAQNLSLAQALERVRAAQAVAKSSGSVLDGDGVVEIERRGGKRAPEVTDSSGALGISWLIDIFGLARFNRESAERDLASVTAQSDAARMLYLSQITQAYIDLRFFEANVKLRKNDVVSRRRTLEVTQTLLDTGQTTELELSRAQSLLNGARVEIPALEASAQVQRNRIATLLGVPAGKLRFSGPVGQPTPRRTPTEGIPADIVRTRPDVRSAEYAYQADLARLGVAKAEIYPSLRLNGNIEVGDLSGTNTSSWGFGPTLVIPVFNRGVLKANIEVADSEAQQSYLVWRESILNAVEEVESAMYSLDKSASTVAASRSLVGSDNRSLELLRELVGTQQVTVLEVIEIERRASEGRIVHAASLRQFALQYIALNVALGAGYATTSNALIAVNE